MGLGSNTTASLLEGTRTTNGTLVWTEVLSCTIASIVVLTFFVGPYRRWHTNPVLKLLILLSSGTPMEKMLSYTIGIIQSAPYDNELHLVWMTFLVIAQGMFTSLNYRVDIGRKEWREIEMSQFLDNFFLARLIFSFPGHSKFRRPLFLLWCLIVAKWIQRMIGFRVANRRYGTDNVNLVADYMSYEHELTNHNEVDPTDMKGYKYLVVGEDDAKTKTQTPQYRLRLETNENVITIEKVWQCQGKLLSSSGNLGSRLKDVCLSFALFKLLRRRFFDYSAAEAEHAKTRDFVFRGLLKEEDHERVFQVIKVELEFLHDLFCTKYPIIFSLWFSILCVLQLFIIMTSVWTAVSSLHNYQTPDSDIDRIVDGKNVDVIITHVFVVLIMVMEAWEFCSYWLSNWAKVMLICNYVKQPNRDFLHLDKILGIICRGKLWSPLSDEIGQYSLLKNFRYTNSNIPYHVTWGLMADKKGKGIRKQNAVKLSRRVKEAILHSLRSERRLSNGKLSLLRNEVSAEQLFWACKLPSHTHTIMVWHIATSLCEMMESCDNVDHQQDHREVVATALSRYCAYLLVFAPELLPVSSFAIKYMFEQIVCETGTFFKDCESEESMRKKVTETKDPADTIIKMGAKLANQLMDLEVGWRWKILAEFWAELMLFLAPSDKATEHKEKLETGGEFITHLWALLYHAGILERPQSSHDDTVTASSV